MALILKKTNDQKVFFSSCDGLVHPTLWILVHGLDLV